MFSPREPPSGPKAFGDERLIVVDGRHAVETSCHRRWTIRISEHRSLFGGEKKCLPLRVIGDIPRNSLGTKPFAKLPLIEFGFFGEFLRGSRANFSKRGVNSKPVAKHNERSIYGRTKVVDHLPKKLIKGIRVQ
jgi:hypothetical protein